MKDDKTLRELLTEHNDDGYAPFHMPGHKRNPRFEHLLGVQGEDITEIYGFDNLHDAVGVLKGTNDRAAKVYGVRASRMLVGGSTAGILAAVRALTRRGDGTLIARNCHGSVYNAAELAGLETHYVLPNLTGFGACGAVSREAVERALEENGNIKLVVVTSPTYEGVISDIQGIADACHRRGASLVVDEAHGAHLGFATFEKSARQQGADIVINSLHKTLPALTQSAILHVCAQDVDLGLIDEQLAAFETSSPSYPLMASIDGCVRYLQEGKALAKWAKDICALRRELAGLKSIELYAGEGAQKFDISKLTLVLHNEISGYEFARILRAEYKIELEMAAPNYVIAMCGAGDTPEMYSRLKAALFELDKALSTPKSTQFLAHFENSPTKNGENENSFAQNRDEDGDGDRAFFGSCVALTAIGAHIPLKEYELWQAKDMPFELVPLEEARGRVAAENIRAYPPGCPIVAKGERLDDVTLDTLVRLWKSGAIVSGPRGSFPQNIAVVA